jgi:hypothetical protein
VGYIIVEDVPYNVGVRAEADICGCCQRGLDWDEPVCLLITLRERVPAQADIIGVVVLWSAGSAEECWHPR